MFMKPSKTFIHCAIVATTVIGCGHAAAADRYVPDGGDLQLRDMLVAQIVEYARHCGHADLLRERIDGRVGQ